VATLALWHGLAPALGLSVASLVGGALLYALREPVRRGLAGLQPGRWGPSRAYSLGLSGMLRVAGGQTRLLQSGYLRHYVVLTVLAIGGLAAFALLTRVGAQPRLELTDVEPHESAVAALMLMAALAAARAHSRLAAVAAMGVVGFGVALVFLFFGAPDLALTQAIVEALTVVVFLLALFHLPRYRDLSSRLTRARDLVISLGFGALMTTLVLVATQHRVSESISPYFLENSVPLAHGRNVVNVILVDFRALDTLGEITVLAIAALGVAALLKLGPVKEDPR
jgi:multicomponent Na+:H+ antiporter subunit A